MVMDRIDRYFYIFSISVLGPQRIGILSILHISDILQIMVLFRFAQQFNCCKHKVTILLVHIAATSTVFMKINASPNTIMTSLRHHSCKLDEHFTYLHSLQSVLLYI